MKTESFKQRVKSVLTVGLISKIGHVAVVSGLTVLTQIGGVLWILNFGFFSFKKKEIAFWKRLLSYAGLYILSTLFIVPRIAQLNGRVALPLFETEHLAPHNIITPFLNRHYVKPLLKEQLEGIAIEMNAGNSKLRVSYLDANFPFFDGFPLLPHLSHNDGKKIDLSFYYVSDGKEGNLKPSNSGYGKFVEPKSSEFNQTEQCISNGYWHYGYTEYLSLGGNDNLEFDPKNTKMLIDLIVANPLTQKVFIEPHLKSRMRLMNPKIRFHGCRAVRHDDHIHYQID